MRESEGKMAGAHQQAPRQAQPLRPPPLLQIPPRPPPPVAPNLAQLPPLLAPQPPPPPQQQQNQPPPHQAIRPPAPAPPPAPDADGNIGALLDPNWFRVIIMKCTANIHDGTASVTLDRWQGIWSQLPNEFVESALHASSNLQIKHLILKQHLLTRIPQNFAAAQTGLPTSLVTLDLSHNKFTSLPLVVCDLRALEELHLNHNCISCLPEQISNLTQLTTLSLQVNKLQAIPVGVCNLTALETLNAEDNNLETLPSEICQLQNLMRLYLKCNSISHLPKSITELPNLEELHMSNNRLECVELAGLQSLRQLHLANNKLSSLPFCIIQMELQGLTLSNNPLKYPPLSVCRRGLPAIKAYMLKDHTSEVTLNPSYIISDDDTDYEDTSQ